MYKLTTAAVVLGIASTPCWAQTPVDWTGFYIGGNGGYGWLDVDLSGVDDTFVAFSEDGDDSGGVFGLQFGYNHQVGLFVFGAEADFDWTDLGADSTFDGAEGPVNLSNDLDWVASLRARAGYAIGAFLPFITAGIAWADQDAHYAETDSAFNVNTFSVDNDWGWVIGGGVDYAVNGHWSIRLEDLFYDFGSEGTTDADAGGIVPDTLDFDSQLNVLRIAVNYKL